MTVSVPLESFSKLLNDLFEQVSEGMILCDATGEVRGANQAAGRLLGRSSFDTLALDELFAGPYLARACDYVQQSSDSIIDFLGPTPNGDHLFDCRLCRYVSSIVDSPFYLLTFSGARYAENFLSDGRRCNSIGKLRGPLANLKAAAENLLAYPDMSSVMRSAFENVIAQESVGLARTFDDLADQCKDIPLGRNNLEPVDLAVLVDRALTLAGNSPDLVKPGKSGSYKVLADGRWLQQLLLTLQDFLVENKINLTGIDFYSEAKGSFIYLDLLWEGQPINAADIEKWRRLPLTKAAGSPSGADILRMHGSDLWSQKAEDADMALIRLPLPIAHGNGGDG